SRVGQRSGRLEGHLVLSRRGSRADRDVPVLLVDDIVTTGATLRSCVAALSAAGFTVVGAIALARTPDKGDAGQREGQRDGGVSRAAAVCAAA
ncbi:MAG: phosphoribosyltransferase family protein, partial [Bifidobacterium sp.]|nr:phosphoribosyltransferase family protein [Bifidobacterium sp.]